MASLSSHKLQFKRFVGKCLEIFAVTAVMLLFSTAFAQTGMSITVLTNSDTYDPGETVTISGEVKDTSSIPVPAATISIQVKDPADQTIYISVQYSSSNGSYIDHFVLANDSLTGNYGVFVAAGKSGFADCHAQTSFSVPKVVINQTSDFAISAYPDNRTVKPGESTQFSLSLVSKGGFTSPVSLGILSVPPSLETSFEPQVVVPNGSSTLTVRTQPTAKNGSYVLTVTASGGGRNHSTSVTLVIQGSGCLIATATYESELAFEVQFLRGFREERVMPTHAGRQFLYTFNMFYYSFSPNVARLIESDNGLRALCKVALHPLISILMFTAHLDSLFGFYPEIGVIISGFLASVLIGIIYFSPIAVVLKRILKARGVNLRVRLEEPVFTILLSSVVAISVGEAFPFYATLSAATAIFVVATVCLSVLLFMRFLDSCLKFFRL
mgnify:FL=1